MTAAPALVLVTASLLGRASSTYTGRYDSFLCLGELLRSCCVNLGFDVEQADGVVLNADVFAVRGEHSHLVLQGGYDARTKLSELDSSWWKGDEITLAFRPTGDG